MPRDPNASGPSQQQLILSQLMGHVRHLAKVLPKRPSQSSFMTLYLQWLRSDLEVYEGLTLAGKPLEGKAIGITDVYAGLDLRWRLRFSSWAIGSLERCSAEDQNAVLEKLLYLAGGHLESCRHLGYGPMRHLVCLCDVISRHCCLVLALELNQLPLISKGKLSGFEFVHFMRVVDIATGLHETERIVKLYREQLQGDSAKCIRPLVGQNIEAATDLVTFEESVTFFPDGSVGPISLPNELLSHSTARSYSFNETTQRWTQSFSDQPTPSSLEEPLPDDVLAMISRLGE